MMKQSKQATNKNFKSTRRERDGEKFLASMKPVTAKGSIR